MAGRWRPAAKARGKPRSPCGRRRWSLGCHAASGEIYTLALSRTRLTLSSYEDDAICTAVEDWADAVPALA